MKLFIAFIFISGCCLINSLKMEGVHLFKNKTFVMLQDQEPTVLECRYQLKESKTTKSVTWYHDNHFIFVWMASEPFRLGVNLTDSDIATSRRDGHLEILKINMTFAGNYRCEVTTSAGETFKSFEYQLLIVDFPNTAITTDIQLEGCNVLISMEIPAIAPKPHPVCGAYIPEQNQYIMHAISWGGTPHYNGSVAYALNKEKLKINEIPTDAVIKCEVGISKIDGSYVLLMAKSVNLTEIWERGCPVLEVEDSKTIKFVNMRRTCRDEIASKKESSVAEAHISCKHPFQSKYEYLVTEVILECRGTKWNVAGSLSWNHHDNLICVEASEKEKPNKDPDIPSIAPPVKVRGQDASSGTILSSSLIVCALLVMVVIIGVVFSLNFKKPKRYVD